MKVSKADLFNKPVEDECIPCLLNHMVLKSILLQATALLSHLDARSHCVKLTRITMAAYKHGEKTKTAIYFQLGMPLCWAEHTPRRGTVQVGPRSPNAYTDWMPLRGFSALVSNSQNTQSIQTLRGRVKLMHFLFWQRLDFFSSHVSGLNVEKWKTRTKPDPLLKKLQNSERHFTIKSPWNSHALHFQWYWSTKLCGNWSHLEIQHPHSGKYTQMISLFRHLISPKIPHLFTKYTFSPKQTDNNCRQD